MAQITTYAADKLLDALLRDVAYASTHTYVALFTVAPTMPAGTGGTEVSGGSYVREQLDTNLSAAASESITTSGTLTWPSATADWGTVVGIGIYDALTLGNLLAYGNLTASQPVLNGNTYSMPAGNITATLS